MSSYSLRIVCRAKSHEGKEAIVGRLWHGGEVGSAMEGETLLIDDQPVSTKSVRGGAASPPESESLRQYKSSGRSRSTFTCRLCGLDVQMRAESLQALMAGLIRAGTWTERVSEVSPGEFFTQRVSSISLESLAATM